MTTFLTYLLREHPPGSHGCLDSYQVEVPDGEPQPVKHLESIALTRIKLLPELRLLKSLEVVRSNIYLVRHLCVQISHDLISSFAVYGTDPGTVAARETDACGWCREPWRIRVGEFPAP